MGNIKENKEEVYNWDEPVYLIEEEDYVEGGEDGISNRQASQLTRRTRDLFNRVIDLLRNLTKCDADTLSAAKGYADNKMASLLDSAPETLNTLNELAAALGDDPNFATTVANQIGSKVSTTDPRLSNARPADGGTASYASRLTTDHDCSIGATFDGVSRWKLQANHSSYKGVSVDHADKIGGYSADNLFISNGADRADINNLPASGMWGINKDLGGLNIPFPYGAVVQFAGANGSGGNPIFQMASGTGGNRFFMRSKWYNESLATNEWRELYHTGNFDPTTKVDTTDPRLTNARPANGGISDFLQWLNPDDSVTARDHYVKAIRMDPNGIATRLYLQGGAGVKHDSIQVAHSDASNNSAAVGGYGPARLWRDDNFNPETKANTNDVMRVLRAGKVNASGETMKNKGWFTSERLGSMIYKVTHDIGHTNYITFATCVHSNQVHDISVVSETANYTEFLIGGTSGTSFSTFNFTILEI